MEVFFIACLNFITQTIRASVSDPKTCISLYVLNPLNTSGYCTDRPICHKISALSVECIYMIPHESQNKQQLFPFTACSSWSRVVNTRTARFSTKNLHFGTECRYALRFSYKSQYNSDFCIRNSQSGLCNASTLFSVRYELKPCTWWTISLTPQMVN